MLQKQHRDLVVEKDKNIYPHSNALIIGVIAGDISERERWSVISPTPFIRHRKDEAVKNSTSIKCIWFDQQKSGIRNRILKTYIRVAA